MEQVVIGLIAVVAVLIVVCAILWVEVAGLTEVLAQTREQLRDHLRYPCKGMYLDIGSRQPRSPIDDDPVEAELPWENAGDDKIVGKMKLL